MHIINRVIDLLPQHLQSDGCSQQTQQPGTAATCSPTMTSCFDATPGLPAYATHDTDTVAPPSRRELILRDLWQRMTEKYGVRWTSQHGADPATGSGQAWGDGLIGLTKGQILRVGVGACRGDWPPSLPEFRALCFALPPLPAIRREIADRTAERTPFGLLVSRYLDSWAYRHAGEDRAERMLREAYAEAERYVMDGGELPQVFAALPDHTDREPAPATPEVAEAVLAAMREMLDGAPPVAWRADRGRWVATLRTSGEREARASVSPPAAEGGPWRWVVMVAGDVVEAGEAADGEAGKVAAVRCASGVTA